MKMFSLDARVGATDAPESSAREARSKRVGRVIAKYLNPTIAHCSNAP